MEDKSCETRLRLKARPQPMRAMAKGASEADVSATKVTSAADESEAKDASATDKAVVEVMAETASTPDKMATKVAAGADDSAAERSRCGKSGCGGSCVRGG